MTDQSDDEWVRGLRAEREQAAAAGRPYAVPLDCDVRWDFGAPSPTILQWEGEAHLFFYLRDTNRSVGSIVFERCVASMFGPPGEEGHGLEGSGWDAYTPLRVVNSPWPGRIVAESDGLSHFVLPFHDTTFECVAESFTVSHMWRTMSEGVREVTSHWE